MAQRGSKSVVAGLFCPRQCVLVEHDIGILRTDHLPGAHVGMEQLRVLLHSEYTGDGTPRVAYQVYLVLVEPIPQVVAHLDGISHRLFES